MGRRLSLSLAALLSIATLALAPPVSGGEFPDEGTCDDTDLLVCAGANAGGNVDCFFVTPTSVECDWSHGTLWAAFSPAALPGSADVSWTASVEVCVAGACETTPSNGADPTCTWLPALECVGDHLATGSEGPFELAVGECVRVTVSRSITVDARVLNVGPPLAEASFTNSGGDAGIECVLDNGR